MKTIIDIDNRRIAGICKVRQFKEQIQQLKAYVQHCEGLTLDELRMINKR